MTERTYIFELVCPRCGKTSQTTQVGHKPQPRVNCGDCLMNDVEIVEFKVLKVDVVRALAVILALLVTTDARAQYRDLTIYGSDARVQSRTHTDSAGSTTIYGADGKVQGRTSTGSNGTTTVYGSDGRVQSTIVPSGMGQRR